MKSENELIRRAFEEHYGSKVKGLTGTEADAIISQTKNKSVEIWLY